MCEATVIIMEDNTEKKVIKDVEIVDVNENDLRITNILGVEERIEGKIKRIDLIQNQIIVVSPEKTKKHNGQGVYMPNGGN